MFKTFLYGNAKLLLFVIAVILPLLEEVIILKGFLSRTGFMKKVGVFSSVLSCRYIFLCLVVTIFNNFYLLTHHEGLHA